MSYDYQQQRAGLFTEAGQGKFLEIRDKVKALLETAGAFRQSEAFKGVSGDSWENMACLDRLVELGEIVELRRECWAQYRVFTTPQVHNH